MSRAMTTDIAPGELFILTETAPTDTIFTFQFQLVNQDQSINVMLIDERGKTLQLWKDANEGVFDIEVPSVRKDTNNPLPAGPKTIKVLFDNQQSILTSKTVNFFFRTRLLLDVNSHSDKLDPIEQEVNALAASMHHLQTLQVQLRQQQKEHRKTV